MRDEEIWEILIDWNLWGRFEKEFKEREFYVNKTFQLMRGREIVVLKGVRRSGKSSIVYLVLKKLIENIEKKNTLVINFEDPRFPSTLDAKDMIRIYNLYLRKMNPEEHVVVLDEVQVVRRWERFARFLTEAKNSKVIVTGSSSKLMSEEYASVLTGRHLDVEVFPLSFREFLNWKGLKIRNEIEILKQKHRIQNLLEEYINFGGFPEVVLSEGERKIELIRGYFDDIITKDVAKRFNIREIEKLENLVKNYISNISTLQSFNRLKNVIGLSLDSVERFSKYLETARIMFFLPKFGYSVKQHILSPKKIYAIDTGFYSAIGFKFMENVGRLMENMVAIELFRKKSLHPLLEVYYWKDYQGKEVDFVVKEGQRVKELIQVTHASGRDEIEKREIRSLVKASRELGCKNLLVITWDYEDEENLEGRRIRFLPLWKWLIKENI